MSRPPLPSPPEGRLGQPKRTPWEMAEDRERGLKLDPLNMPKDVFAQAHTTVLETLRELRSAAAIGAEGWVRPRDLFDRLYEVGWPYPDPNYVLAAMKDEGVVEEEMREVADGSFAVFYRLDLSSVAVRPSTRQRPSGLAG